MPGMKTYIPDPEKWARYFDRDKSKEGIVTHGYRPGIIRIEDPKPSKPKSETLRIEAVTPVQQQTERVESELRRLGAIKTKERKRKRQDQRGGGSSDRQLKRISARDTSGF